MWLDNNGQPEPGFHATNNEIKAINTLYGLILGITADQNINDNEINFLNLWLKDNEAYTNSFPLNVIKSRIDDILQDNIITSEERDDFYQTLSKIQGGTYQETGAAGGLSTNYGNADPDYIVFPDSRFCFTGAFVTGTRDKCEQMVVNLGGIPAKSVTKDLNYLVIGALASRDWIATSHGRKIEKALHYQSKGSPVTILSEETWARLISLNN